MDIAMLRSTFGTSPIEFLPAAKTAADIAARNQMLVVGAVVLVTVTVVATVLVYQKIAEQNPIKLAKGFEGPYNRRFKYPQD